MRMIRSPVALLFACVVSLFGCGPARIDRVPVAGQVLLNDEPLESGHIAFQPRGSGPSAGGEIVSGRFSLNRANGPVAGAYRVEIMAYRKTGRQIPDSDRPGEMTEEKVQIIPSRYNAESELQTEIPAGGKNDLSFSLNSP